MLCCSVAPTLSHPLSPSSIVASLYCLLLHFWILILLIYVPPSLWLFISHIFCHWYIHYPRECSVPYFGGFLHLKPLSMDCSSKLSYTDTLTDKKRYKKKSKLFNKHNIIFFIQKLQMSQLHYSHLFSNLQTLISQTVDGIF